MGQCMYRGTVYGVEDKVEDGLLGLRCDCYNHVSDTGGGCLIGGERRHSGVLLLDV